MDRREFLAAATTTTAGLVLPGSAAVAARRRAEPLARAGSFPLGVWAGSPGERSIVLGTKVDGLERASKLTLEVARDAQFANVVHRQQVRSAPFRDFAIKQRVSGRRLAPGERYFYRFATRDSSSPVGRLTTARPADSMEPVRIGFFSCQKWSDGYYTAHRGLAQEADLDAIVCLGDYMYETDSDEGLPDRRDATSSGENGQCETLADYRAKYRLYKGDPDLQAMHASAAFLATWDDHEVENNYAGDVQGTTRRRRIDHLVRRTNAYNAWFEHMPVERLPADRNRIYGHVPLGGMVDLFVLDQRQYRSDQPCNDEPLLPCPDAEDPALTMLGPAQKQWFKDELSRSRAAWKVVASSVQMMSSQSVPTLPVNPDGWDGYRAERAELMQHVIDRDIEDVSVITGDIHYFLAGDVHVGGDVRTPAAATEFVGGSISSEAIEDAGLLATEQLIANPHFRYINFVRRGYGILEATPQELRVAFRSPRSTKQRTSPVQTLASFVVQRGTPRVERA